MADITLGELIGRIRLGHEANAGFHLSADEMEMLLSAAECSMKATPPGYALVPLVVTDKMAIACGWTMHQDLWELMLEAAAKTVKARDRK